MGFLDRLFAKKQYTLAEALDAIAVDMKRLQQSQPVLHETEIAALEKAVQEFKKKPIPETARRSAAVKQRFCSVAEAQISQLPKTNYTDAVRSMLNNFGGLTQRQILHLGFFFKEDFRPIAKKIADISAVVNAKPAWLDHKAVLDMDKRIKEIEEKKTDLEKTLAEETEKLSALKAQMSGIPDIVEHIDQSSLDRAESIVRSIRQEIDSFLTVQKLLRRHIHATNTKDALIENYIESPSTAILSDENIEILDVLGKIGGDSKLTAILGGRQFLLEKRKQLLAALEHLEKEKQNLAITRASFYSALRERNEKVSRLEHEIRAAEKAASETTLVIASLSKEHAVLSIELKSKASKLLGAEVV